jgi:16S rRNA (adenine1518-N6/adenine1519-N6)-dimethyltransferase
MEIKAKKSLGQNFLKSKGAISSIIRAGNIQPSDTILEIGPGKGVLTEELVKIAGKVVAVEKDDRLIEHLQEKFHAEIENGKLELIHQDILEWNRNRTPGVGHPVCDNGYKVIANIPYYITGQLIRQFLESESQPSLMVLMLQKEVAKRIVARDEKESILSLSVKAYGEPKYIETVPARYFSPAPKVDSAILLITNISKQKLSGAGISEKNFFTVIKAGLAHKRKVLVKNLEAAFDKTKIEKVFAQSGLGAKTRGEDLSLSQWLEISSLLFN